MKFIDLVDNPDTHINIIQRHVNEGVAISDLVDVEDSVCLRYQPLITPWKNSLNYDSLDLPFKKCFFESSGDNVLFNIDGPNGERLFVFAVMIVEHSPRNYSIDVMGFDRIGDKSSPVYLSGLDYFKIRGPLDALLDRLQVSKKQCFTVEKTSTIKWGKKVDRVVTSSNKVIYIGGSKINYNSNGSTKYTPSKYSFNVRGHWRVIDSKSIGKDRDGIRCVKGMTWVSECSKGSGPLLRKTYVVKS